VLLEVLVDGNDGMGGLNRDERTSHWDRHIMCCLSLSLFGLVVDSTSIAKLQIPSACACVCVEWN
jgi:hypothetical protein